MRNILTDARVGSVIASRTISRGNFRTIALTIVVLTFIVVNLVFSPAVVNGMTGIFIGAATDYVYGSITIEPVENELYLDDADSIISKVNAIPGVTGAAKRMKSSATLTNKEKFQGASLIGINPEDEVYVTKLHEAIIKGDFLTKEDREEIILGRFVAGEEDGAEILDNLGGVKVGTLINVSYSNGVKKQYRVKGILSAGTGITDTLTLVNFKELESVLNLTGAGKASEIVVKIETPGEEDRIKRRIIEVGVKERVLTWQEKIQDLIKDILDSFNILNVVSSIVSLVVAVFVLFIIIYINTLNRRKQIGILRAIGISPRSIILSYIMISLFYVLLGIIGGTIVTMFLVYYFTANPIQFATTGLIPIISIPVIIQSVISLLITAVVAGFIPAWLVTREDILKAIWG